MSPILFAQLQIFENVWLVPLYIIAPLAVFRALILSK